MEGTWLCVARLPAVSADGRLRSSHKAEVEGGEAEATGLVGPPDGLRRPNACLAEHVVVTTGMRSETAVRMRCVETNGVRQHRLISVFAGHSQYVGLAGLEPAASFSISAITAYRHAILPFPGRARPSGARYCVLTTGLCWMAPSAASPMCEGRWRRSARPAATWRAG